MSLFLNNKLIILFVSVFLIGCGKESRSSVLADKPATNRNTLCDKSISLKDLEGVWADENFIATLEDTRSWSDASKVTMSGVSSILIKNEKIFYTWQWHEGSNTDETDRICANKDSGKIFLSFSDGGKFDGPFVRIGSGSSEEQLYLTKFWDGCYKSEQSEKWCFSKDGVHVNGDHLPAVLQKDMSETPNYGTIFRVDGQNPPFMIFVPQDDGGWLVYKDDWASSDGYIPVKVGIDPPWRRLMKE